MYKDKGKEREATKERVRRYRNRGVTSKGVTREGVTNTGLTQRRGLIKGVTEQTAEEYPAIIRALVDPMKRAMLEFVAYDLTQKRLGDKLRYGVNGCDFNTIADLLSATSKIKL